MHPPPFRLTHRLSDWPDCRLELHCCRGATVYPVRLLMTNSGDPTWPCRNLRAKSAVLESALFQYDTARLAS
jgi:hypothetical protein